MSCHDVHLLCCAVKLDGLTKFLVAFVSGLSFVVWPLRGVLGGLIIQYFALFRRVPGDVQQACSPSGSTIACMA